MEGIKIETISFFFFLASICHGVYFLVNGTPPWAPGCPDVSADPHEPPGARRQNVVCACACAAYWLMRSPCPSPGPSAVATVQHRSCPRPRAQFPARGTCWVGAEGGWGGPRAPESGEGKTQSMPERGSGKLDLV